MRPGSRPLGGAWAAGEEGHLAAADRLAVGDGEVHGAVIAIRVRVAAGMVGEEPGFGPYCSGMRVMVSGRRGG